MTLGQLISDRREQSGMSLQDLADACGATKGHIHSIETGNVVNIGFLLGIRLSLALGVPVNTLAASVLETVVDKKYAGPDAAKAMRPRKFYD